MQEANEADYDIIFLFHKIQTFQAGPRPGALHSDLRSGPFSLLGRRRAPIPPRTFCRLRCAQLTHNSDRLPVGKTFTEAGIQAKWPETMADGTPRPCLPAQGTEQACGSPRHQEAACQRAEVGVRCTAREGRACSQGSAASLLPTHDGQPCTFPPYLPKPSIAPRGLQPITVCFSSLSPVTEGACPMLLDFLVAPSCPNWKEFSAPPTHSCRPPAKGTSPLT